MNHLKTLALLSMLTALLLRVGQTLAGRGGLLLAFVIAVAMNFGAYWLSDRLVLRMHGARELRASDVPELFSVVHGLVNSTGLPMPKLYLIPDDSPSAFATGRNPQHGAVAVTEGLLWLLNRQEIAAVGSPATAHLCIMGPFCGGGLVRLLSTNPPTAKRVERLEAMAVRGYPAAV